MDELIENKVVRSKESLLAAVSDFREKRGLPREIVIARLALPAEGTTKQSPCGEASHSQKGIASPCPPTAGEARNDVPPQKPAVSTPSGRFRVQLEPQGLQFAAAQRRKERAPLETGPSQKELEDLEWGSAIKKEDYPRLREWFKDFVELARRNNWKPLAFKEFLSKANAALCPSSHPEWQDAFGSVVSNYIRQGSWPKNEKSFYYELISFYYKNHRAYIFEIVERNNIDELIRRLLEQGFEYLDDELVMLFAKTLYDEYGLSEQFDIEEIVYILREAENEDITADALWKDYLTPAIDEVEQVKKAQATETERIRARLAEANAAIKEKRRKDFEAAISLDKMHEAEALYREALKVHLRQGRLRVADEEKANKLRDAFIEAGAPQEGAIRLARRFVTGALPIPDQVMAIALGRLLLSESEGFLELGFSEAETRELMKDTTISDLTGRVSVAKEKLDAALNNRIAGAVSKLRETGESLNVARDRIEEERRSITSISVRRKNARLVQLPQLTARYSFLLDASDSHRKNRQANEIEKIIKEIIEDDPQSDEDFSREVHEAVGDHVARIYFENYRDLPWKVVLNWVMSAYSPEQKWDCSRLLSQLNAMCRRIGGKQQYEAPPPRERAYASKAVPDISKLEDVPITPSARDAAVAALEPFEPELTATFGAEIKDAVITAAVAEGCDSVPEGGLSGENLKGKLLVRILEGYVRSCGMGEILRHFTFYDLEVLMEDKGVYEKVLQDMIDYLRGEGLLPPGLPLPFPSFSPRESLLAPGSGFSAKKAGAAHVKGHRAFPVREG